MFFRRPALYTYQDFCALAKKHYGDEAQNLDRMLQGLGISRIEVVCYINWMHGMTQQQIAKELDLEHYHVSRYIDRLRPIFPELFNFDVPRSVLQYRPKAHDEIATHKF